MSLDAAKVSAWVPVSREFLIDVLPFRTSGWPPGEKAAEYLRYDRSVILGTTPFTAATVAENVEYVWQWDDEDFLPYVDWPEENYGT